ncbi:hypothetical protein RQP46_001515 [Phenoliferia psychrophenolica]
MLAPRSFSSLLSTSRAALRTTPLLRAHQSTFEGPHGTGPTYLADRAAAEDFIRSNGWDMGSLVEVPIEWGMHDGFGHVNNVHSLRFFERGRLHFIKSLLVEMDDPVGAEDSLCWGKPGNVGMILASVTARYRRPVTFPDTLLVAHRALPIERPDRFKLETLCYSFAQKAAVTLGESELAAYDYGNLKKMDIPSDLLAALEKRTKKVL